MKLNQIFQYSKKHTTLLKVGLGLCVLLGTSLILGGCNKSNTQSVNITQPHTHRVIQSKGWHAGTPFILKPKATWKSNPRAINSSQKAFNKKASFISYVLTSKNGHGIDPVQKSLDKSGKVISSGTISSVYATFNPHYRTIGHNLIQLTSGGVDNPSHARNNHNNKRSLTHELNGSLNYAYGATWLLKINGRHSFTLWEYNNPQGVGKKHLYGTFTVQK